MSRRARGDDDEGLLSTNRSLARAAILSLLLHSLTPDRPTRSDRQHVQQVRASPHPRFTSSS